MPRARLRVGGIYFSQRDFMKPNPKNDAPVVVIGGGIIGLAAGWQLLRAGHDVTLFESDEVGHAASWAAAGMLAPHAEVGFEDESFLAMALESLREYPRFLEELREDSGTKVSLDTCGTLMVAFNRDDSERIRRLFTFREGLGLPVQWLSGDEARDIEPLLSPKVIAAIWLPEDGQVNNRDVLRALRTAFQSRGGRVHTRTRVTSVRISGGRATHVRTDAGVGAVRASKIVVAAGCWSAGIEGIPEDMRPPVRPVKGQIVSLTTAKGFGLAHVVRAPDVYLLPKSDGRVVVGATQEEMGFDTTPTAGEVMRLLERGWEAVPSIYELGIGSIDVGLRPGSRDNNPIVGATSVRDLYYATGHFRHGIILAPVTAYAIREVVGGGPLPEVLKPADPLRFASNKETHATDDQRGETRL
jgi:glycine oxidase